MWQVFTKVMPDTTDEQSRSALTLLGMVGSIEPNLIISNVNILVEHGLDSGNMKIVHDTCLALSKIANNLSKGSGPEVAPMRFDQDHELFVKLEKIILESVGNKNDDQFIPMSQQAITVIYSLSDCPDDLAAKICRNLAEKLVERPKSVLLLRRVFFVVGHMAACQVRDVVSVSRRKFQRFQISCFQ